MSCTSKSGRTSRRCGSGINESLRPTCCASPQVIETELRREEKPYCIWLRFEISSSQNITPTPHTGLFVERVPRWECWTSKTARVPPLYTRHAAMETSDSRGTCLNKAQVIFPPYDAFSQRRFLYCAYCTLEAASRLGSPLTRRKKWLRASMFLSSIDISNYFSSIGL